MTNIISKAHDFNVKVVSSNHDFDKTPEKEELIRRLCKMQELGADIPKIAVMPTCRRDVLMLLDATLEMTESYADRPIITMSMAGTGVISRLAGEAFGSALTFGAATKAVQYSLLLGWLKMSCLKFFQAEDGIRDDLVTGVQTCALPI